MYFQKKWFFIFLDIMLRFGSLIDPVSIPSLSDPNHQSKSQEDLTLFNCRQWVKLGGVRGLKLTGDVGYYGHADKSGSKS